MATFNTIRGQEPSTVTFKVATVQVVRNSSNIQQEILSLGDAESSLGIARVLNAAPASTEYGLVVRIAGGPSSVADLTVRAALSSTAADNPVTVAGYSTVVSVSTGSVRVHQSSAADLNVTVAGYVAPSTTVTVSTGSIRANLSSTAADNPVSVWQLAGPGTVNTFGHIITGTPHNQVDVQFYRSSSVNDAVTLLSSNGGGATVSNGGAIFATGANSSGAVTGISVERTRYTAGAEVYGLFTAAYTVPSTANQFMRVGLFDSSNGLFAGYESTAGFGITRRAAGSDSNVLSSAFNHDKLNGNSTSLFTRNGTPEALDPTKLNVFRVRFGWLGAAPISWDVLAPDGHWVTFHVYDWPNTSTLASLASADLPMRLECRKVNAGTDDLRIFTECWGAGTTQDGRPINDPISTGALAPLVRSVITGENSAGGGSFVNVKVNPSGAVVIDGTISSLAGIVTVRPSDTNWASSAGFHFTAGGALQVSDSTVVSVSTGSVRVHQSTAADLNVTVAGYSTIAAISSVSGIVAVRPSDTNWASSAGFHFDGSGNLNIAGSFSASTVVTVSQLLDSSGGSVSVGDNVNQALRVNVVAGAAGGSTVVTVSTGSVRVHQSTAADLNVTVAGYSTTVNVSSLAGKVTVDQNSTVWFAHARVFDSSGVAIAASTAAPATGDNGLTVRQVGFVAFSTTVQVSSLAGKVLVDQNSTVWPVQVSSVAGRVLVDQNSTVWPVQVSSVAGVVTVTPNAGSTWAVRPLQSSQADLRVTVYQSTAADLVATARTQDGVGNALESSTLFPSSNARGLIVRQVISGPTTYSASTTGQSSVTTIFTSNATVKPYVFAYSITSTLAGPVEWGIYDGATRKWGGVLAATSSAISGANLAVSPPGCLFTGSTGSALTFNVASSNTGVNVSIAYWQCP